jgi:hypothetical protein
MSRREVAVGGAGEERDLPGDRTRREHRELQPFLVPLPQPGRHVGEELGGEVAVGVPLLPDQALQRLERGDLLVRVHPAVQDRDDLVRRRVLGQPAELAGFRDGVRDHRVVTVRVDPRAQPRPRVVVQHDVHLAGRGERALDVEDHPVGVHGTSW